MKENKSENFSDSAGEKGFKEKVLEEMKEVAYSESPSPQEDWDLVWVLSGPEKSIGDVPKKGKRNEDKDRMETAISVVKRVTALRLGKEQIERQDVLLNGPVVYFNGTDEQNNELKKLIKEGFFMQYDFPDEKIIISENLGLAHTGDQFDKMPADLLETQRKVVIVSSAYHLPRVKRYVEKYKDKFPSERVILYPAEPKNFPVGKTLGEIKKIPKYAKKEILPPEGHD